MKELIFEARRNNRLPAEGTKLRTKVEITPAKECDYFFVAQKHIDNRKPNAQGEFIGWVPGGGGDLWWVKHSDGSVAAYVYNEVTDI